LIELLVAARKTRGLRQAGLAYALRNPQSWVSVIERGQRRIDVVEYLDLAEAIGFDPLTMLAEVQAIPPDKPPRAIPPVRSRKVPHRRHKHHYRPPRRRRR
jgi:HTH-type transcriptional regulator/antitoxin HipB